MTIRLITIDENNVITLGSSDMFLPMTGRERAIQRLMLSLFNRPGTNVEEPAWGAGVKQHLGQRIRVDARVRAAEIADMLNASLSMTEDVNDPWAIAGVDLVGSERLTRGRKITLLVRWQRNPDEQISLEVS